MPYSVDPNNAAWPLDTDDASFAAAELRAIKARLNTQFPGYAFISGGTGDAITGTLPTLVDGLVVVTVPPGPNTIDNPTLNGITIYDHDGLGGYQPVAIPDYSDTSAVTLQYLVAAGPGWVVSTALTGLLSQVNVWTRAQRSGVEELFSIANSTAIDLSLKNSFKHTMTENTTLAVPTNVGVDSAQSGAIEIFQDAGTPYTFDADNAFWKWAGGTPVAIDAGLESKNLLCYYIGADGTYGVLTMQAGVA